MADNPNRYFARTNNTRERDTHRETIFTNRNMGIPFQDYVGEETITIRNSNIPRSTGRMGGNNRNRHSVSNSRRFDRNRRSDPNYNRQVLLQNSVGNSEINNERPQDNKENQSGSPTKPNNNIENLINRNTARNIQDNRSINILQSSAHAQSTGEHVAHRCEAHAKKDEIRSCTSLFNLPKREPSLSPTRINASTSNLNRNQNQRTSDQIASTSFYRDPTQGASSVNFNMASTPSTSHSSEASGSQAQPKGLMNVDEKWINAPEFHPKNFYNTPACTLSGEQFEKNICEWILKYGFCSRLPYCSYTHDGEICDICNKSVLHPTDTEQRRRHRRDCRSRQDRHKELAVKVAHSVDKTCGICFEVVVQKESYERRFGILNQCNHVFCLSCIRRWRQARQFEHKVVKACPECRVTSEFVCPSQYWVDTKEEKDQLIESYKKVLAKKPCKYFRQGHGNCPFGNKCFYLHALPDGTKADVGPPPRRRVPNRQREERIIGIDLDQLILWDLNNDFEHHWLYSLAEDVEDLAAFFSDSDDSDGGDFDFFFQ